MRFVANCIAVPNAQCPMFNRLNSRPVNDDEKSDISKNGRRGRLMLALPFGGGAEIAGPAQDMQKPEAGPREGS